MTYLSDVLDDKLLFDRMLTEGYVRERFHPDFPELSILNYTEKAAFERVWNVVTRNSRGLIWNTETHEVIARPFAKIHNWDEPEAPRITEDAPLYAFSNKEDGSLGILYRKPNGIPAIATRGSFESDQAIKATEMLHASGMAYVYDEYIDSGYTPLFEIIYPENRIVLDYGGVEELVPLGYIEIASGAYLPAPHMRKRGQMETMHDLLMNLSRPNSEGWVAWLDPYKAVKIKQADYVELHRIVTGLNRKSVWKALREGRPTYLALLEQLPDELYAWAEDVASELNAEYATIMRDADEWFLWMLEQDIRTEAGEDDIDRGRFARLVQEKVPHQHKAFMFSFLDGRDVQDKIWQMIEPKGGDK